MSEFKITKIDKSRISGVDYDNLGFGVYLSDHIYESKFRNGEWNVGEIMPYGPLPIEPAMCTLHYGQTIFEGMKAYMTEDGSVNLFRPEKNLERLNRSAKRVCIPEFPLDRFIDAIKELVKIDYKWIPTKPGTSLYIRPVCFGDGNFLGVHASEDYRLFIMTSPVSSYYKEGLKPISIKVEDKYVRAVRGGLGNAKTAGNYAASLLAGEEAKKAGFAQVLWLDGVEQKYIDVRKETPSVTLEAKISYKKEADSVMINPFKEMDGSLLKQFESNTRTFPIQFDFPEQQLLDFILTIPEGYTIGELPEATMTQLPDGTITFIYEAKEIDEKTVQVSAMINYNQRVYPPERYGELKQIHDVIKEKLELPIVIKKNV
jgi:hypothetical protein